MKKSRLVAAVLVAVLGAYLLKAAKELDPLYEPKSLGTDGCRAIPGFVGPEDLIPDHEGGRFFVASLHPKTAPVMAEATATPTTAGGVWMYRPGRAPRRMTIEGGPEIAGHGLGYWKDPSGEARLFAVNHGDNGESVEVLRIEGDRLVHLRSITSPAFINLNDVAPIGLDKFYVTNDHGKPRGIGQRIEDFTFQRNANLLYWDGSAAKVVLEGLGFANGTSFDGERLYVAESTGAKILVLGISPDGAVTRQNELALGPGFDNLTILGPGHFLAATHPSAFLFLRHAGDHAQPAPSQIWEITLDGEKLAKAERILEDDGQLYSAASVAARLGGNLYLGAVFARSLFECPGK
jgi:arylesterase / paraoxonase